jgi:hypothetical protein
LTSAPQFRTSLVMRITKTDRRTSVFMPCWRAISSKLSSDFSTGLTSSKGLPCHPAPTNHHFPRVSDCKRSSSVTRRGSLASTACQLQVGTDDLHRLFLPRDERKRFGSFLADLSEVKVSSMNLVRTLASALRSHVNPRHVLSLCLFHDQIGDIL